MVFLFRLSLTSFYFFLFFLTSPTLCCKSKPTGGWSPFDSCPGDGIVTAVKIKRWVNEEFTGVDGIALRCNHPEDSHRSTHWITSKIGDNGDWTSTESCPYGSYITRVQVRSHGSESFFGATDVILSCQNIQSGSVVKRLYERGDSGGEWEEKTNCATGNGICGLRTQYFSEGYGLRDVEFTCCTNKQTILPSAT